MRIQLSESVRNVLDATDGERFTMTPRGQIEIKVHTNNIIFLQMLASILYRSTSLKYVI